MADPSTNADTASAGVNVKVDVNISLQAVVADIQRELTVLQKTATGVSASIQGSFDGTADTMQQIAQSVANIDDKLHETHVNIDEQSLKAAEGLRAAGEGALTLARGIAFVATDSDEQLRSVNQQIDTVQQTFSLFTGSIETVKGVVEVMGALRSISGAAAVAQTAVAAGNTAVATTGGVAATAMTALQAALGPIGLAILGITAAVSALALAWKFFNKADEPVKQSANALRDFDAAMPEVEKRAELHDLRADVRTERLKLNQPDPDAPLPLKEQLGVIRTRQEAKLQDVQRLARSYGSGSLDLLRPDPQALQRLQSEANSDDEGVSQRSQAILESVKAAQQIELETRRSVQDALKSEGRLHEENKRTVIEQLKAAEAARDTARQAAQEARQKRTAGLDRFAETIQGLSPEKLAVARRIAEKINAKQELTRGEAEFLETEQLTDKYARQARVKAGKELDSDVLATAFVPELNAEVALADAAVRDADANAFNVQQDIRQKFNIPDAALQGNDPFQGIVDEFSRRIQQNEEQQRRHMDEIVGVVDRLTDTSNLLGQLKDMLAAKEQERALNSP